MARITPDHLWRVVVETGLCTSRAAGTLRAEHDGSTTAADAPAVAAWLVDRRVLTPWQAKRLTAGDDGPFVVGDYRLLERHDHPGETREFTARHQPSGRIVTLVLPPKKPWRERAIREAFLRRLAIATRAADPLLVRAEAIEEADGRPLVVCEEVRGEALADELERRGPPPLREAGEIALAVARALAELHAAGEVHGGLSLDALVRESPAAGGRLRLRQFPLATDPLALPPRAPVETEEQVVALGRRAAFIAPELVAGAACDPRSDVYALGCVLHALVTGRTPGWHGDAHETLARAAASGPGPVAATAPAPLATLVDYLTARDPQDRYPDAAEAARGIAACFGLPPPAPATAPRVDGDASAAVTPPPVPPLDTRARRTAAAEAARRRGGRLRLAGRVIAGAILLAAAAIVVVDALPDAARRRGRPRRAAVARQREPQAGVVAPPAPATEPPAPDRPARAPEPAAVPRGPAVVDDPSLPWASPTERSPLVPAYLPAGSQVIVAARPAALLADGEGRLFVRALGPRVERALAAVAAACGCRPEDIESLQAGWQADGTDDAVVGWTVRLVEGTTLPADAAFRARAWGPPAPAARAGETIHSGPWLSFWVPTSGAGRVLVAAPAARLEEIVVASAAADPPPLVLPSDLERLVDVLHGARHLTVVGAPHFLLNAGRSGLAGELAPLAAGVESLLGEAVPAAALSVHCGDDFYAELDVVPALDVRPADVAARLRERIAGLPAAVEAFCAARDLHPYGRALVMKLPTMVRVLAAQVRSGSEGRIAVATVRLPRAAGHNIALAAELLLSQAAGGGGGVAPTAPAAPQDALGRLGRTMTLRFEKDTLEKSVQMIADEIGVPLEILGPDLQVEGITKNQSFAIDERDKPAADILRVILAKANPDGKLVYVVRRRDGVESIAITTRAAVARRGDVLPPAVRQDGGAPIEESK